MATPLKGRYIRRPQTFSPNWKHLQAYILECIKLSYFFGVLHKLGSYTNEKTLYKNEPSNRSKRKIFKEI